MVVVRFCLRLLALLYTVAGNQVSHCVSKHEIHHFVPSFPKQEATLY
jgi:hypothetical protein